MQYQLMCPTSIVPAKFANHSPMLLTTEYISLFFFGSSFSKLWGEGEHLVISILQQCSLTRFYTVGLPTSNPHLDISKLTYGQFQKMFLGGQVHIEILQSKS